MKLLLLITGGFIGLAVVLVLISWLVLNTHFDSRTEAQEFATGTLPSPGLDGSYKGNHFDGLGKDWLGKQFNSAQNTGINNFKSKSNGPAEQRYTFATSAETGLRNNKLVVLQLNYNKPGNPIWLRPIRDELVQTNQGEYLGKIHLKLGPIVITLGYFRLSK